MHAHVVGFRKSGIDEVLRECDAGAQGGFSGLMQITVVISLASAEPVPGGFFERQPGTEKCLDACRVCRRKKWLGFVNAENAWYEVFGKGAHHVESHHAVRNAREMPYPAGQPIHQRQKVGFVRKGMIKSNVLMSRM